MQSARCPLRALPRVPLIIRGAWIPRGAVRASSCQRDVAPTIVAATGATPAGDAGLPCSRSPRRPPAAVGTFSREPGPRPARPRYPPSSTRASSMSSLTRDRSESLTSRRGAARATEVPARRPLRGCAPAPVVCPPGSPIDALRAVRAAARRDAFARAGRSRPGRRCGSRPRLRVPFYPVSGIGPRPAPRSQDSCPQVPSDGQHRPRDHVPEGLADRDAGPARTRLPLTAGP